MTVRPRSRGLSEPKERRIAERIASAFPLELVPEDADARVLARARALADMRSRRERRRPPAWVLAAMATTMSAIVVGLLAAMPGRPITHASVAPAAAPPAAADRGFIDLSSSDSSSVQFGAAGKSKAPNYGADALADVQRNARSANKPSWTAPSLLREGLGKAMSLEPPINAYSAAVDSLGDPAPTIADASKRVSFGVLVPTYTLDRPLTGVFTRELHANARAQSERALCLAYGPDILVTEWRYPLPADPQRFVDERVRVLSPLASPTTVGLSPAVKVEKGTARLLPAAPSNRGSISTVVSSVTWIENGTVYCVSTEGGASPESLLVIARAMTPLFLAPAAAGAPIRP